MKHSHQKGFLLPLLIIIIAALAIGGGVYVHNKNKTTSSVQVSTEVNANTTASSTNQTANWKTYTNTQHHFTFKYPTYLNLEDDGGDMVAVTWPQTDPTISNTFMYFRLNYDGYNYDPDTANQVLSTATNGSIGGVPVKVVNDPYTAEIIYFMQSPVVGFNSMNNDSLTTKNIEKDKPTQIEVWSVAGLSSSTISEQETVSKQILASFTFTK